MGAFEFQALDATGRLKKGILEGDTPRQIRQILKERGLAPVFVTGVAEKESRHKEKLFTRRGVSATDLALITRQLATLVGSGTVLEEALGTVAEQTEKPRIKSILLAIRSRVMEGHGIETALGEFPAVFPDIYRATVAAGEQAGHLEIVFDRLADYTEFRQKLRQKIMLALLYPLLLTGVAILVVTVLLVYVIPQVVEVFDNIGQELPLLTRALIVIADFIRTSGPLVLLLMAAIGTAAALALRRPDVRLRFHRMLFALPLVAKFVRILNTSRFARSFSILTASGVPVLEGLQLSARVIANLAMRQAVEEAALRVREGGSLHRTLAQSGYFSPIAIHLIASGEASSNLEQMLERTAEAQENEIETLIAAGMSVFEPLLILVMGGMVLLIVLAILLPIFDLNQLVK